MRIPWPYTGAAGAFRWAQEWLPADTFAPIPDLPYGVPTPPVPGLFYSVPASGYACAPALSFGPPGTAMLPLAVGAGRTWFTPSNFDNTDLPWFQAVYQVNNDGAIGNRHIELATYYFPYEDQYVLGVTGINWGDLSRNVLSPPAPTPSARIYFTPEVQLSPSDPEGYLDPNMAWYIGVHRLPPGIIPAAPDDDDYTGDCYFLGLRIRYRTT